jgi:hypothetical protein
VAEPPQTSVEEAPAVRTVERESDSTDGEDLIEGPGKGFVHSIGGKAPRKGLATKNDGKSTPNTGIVGPEESSIEEPEDASSQKPVGQPLRRNQSQCPYMRYPPPVTYLPMMAYLMGQI